MILVNLLRHLFCKHEQTEFIGNIHGDLINQISTKRCYRSAHRCLKCGEIVLREELNHTACEERHPTYNDYLYDGRK